MRRERADAAPQLLDQQRVLVRHGEPVGERRGGAGRRGPAVGGVARQKRQHPAQRAVLLLVRQIAVEHVGDRAEQQVGDRRSLEFVCGTGIHLVKRLRRLARVEPPQRPGRRLAPGHQPGHPVDRFGAVHLVDVRQQLHRVGVVDEGFVADAAQRYRHHVEVDRRQLVEAEFTAHRRRRRDLHRAGDLELVAVEKLHGGGHPAGVQLEIEAERAQPGLLEQCGCGQSVVARADDDRVKVRHRLRLTRLQSFVNIDETSTSGRVADALPQRSRSASAHSRASSGSERSSPSIQTSIAPNTAAAMHRAVTVMCIRSSVPGFGGLSPREVFLDGLGEVGLDLADVSHDPARVEFLGAQRRRSWRRPSRRTASP